MKKRKIFLLVIAVIISLFYSCTLNDEDAVADTIRSFFTDYNNNREEIKNNCTGTAQGQDMDQWRTVFGLSTTNYNNVTYSILKTNIVGTVASVDFRVKVPNSPLIPTRKGTFILNVDTNGNWKITNIPVLLPE